MSRMQQLQNRRGTTPAPRLVAPSRAWAGLVETYYSFKGPVPLLSLPTGGVDLMFMHSSEGDLLPSILIDGHATEGFMTPRVELSGMEIRFRPGGFTALTGIPQDEVSGGLYDFAELVGRRLIKRLDRIVFNARAAEEPGTLEAVVEEMARKSGPGPSWLNDVNWLCFRRRRIELSEIAASAGLSMRQLERVSQRYFGTNPKTLTRVLRLRRSLRRRVSGSTWTEAAFDAGYADQAHLSREARAIIGLSPTQFLRLWRNGEVCRI